MDIASTVLPKSSTCKTEWEYDWPLPDKPDNKGKWLLKVDEHSSQEDIEAEVEYWMNEVRVWGANDCHGKAIMAAIRWMTGFLV